jgi:hypothetical protein
MLSAAAGSITGIRSWTGATNSFGRVVMIVQLSMITPVSSSLRAVQRPANENSSYSGRWKWIGYFFPSLPTVHS